MDEKIDQIESLLGDFLDSGIIKDNKRNRLLVNLVIAALTVLNHFLIIEEDG